MLNEVRADDCCGQHEQGPVEVQPPLEANAQLAETGKPRIGRLYHSAMLSQAFAAFAAPVWQSCLIAVTAPICSASRIVMRLCLHAASRACRAALGCINAFFEQHEPCRLAPLARMTSGVPLASTTIWRLEPSLPRSVGLWPASCPRVFGAEELSSWPGSNQSGRADAGAAAWPDAAFPKRLLHSASPEGHCQPGCETKN